MAERKRNPKIQIGQRFGRWTVLMRARTTSARRELGFLCKCDCGAESVVVGYQLHIGKSKSCGCYSADLTSARYDTGQSRTRIRGKRVPEYSVYIMMLRRCRKSSNKQYSDYGGRGIYVDERWNTFTQFIADMGPRPTPSHSIDRKDNDGPYSPDNCYWATAIEQANNKRSNIIYEIDGRRQTLGQWIREYDLQNKTMTVRMRLRRGWSIVDALTRPRQYRP